MSSWAARRRRFYLEIVLGVLALVVGTVWFINREPPSCFDRKQNQEEAGVDCGGPCTVFCPAQVIDPIVRWARAFPVSGGLYNAVAYVENRNPSAATRRVTYNFKLYDRNNILIAQRAGETFILPKGITPVFEGAIQAGERVPARTLFEFTSTPVWERTVSEDRNVLIVENSALSLDGVSPRLSAQVTNTSIATLRDIGVVAVVYDTKRNAVGASRTVIDELGKDESARVTFVWPEPFETQVERCVVPVDVALILDTSGSMNNDGEAPPQPLTNAKQAADSFIRELGLEDRVSVVSFATRGTLVQALTNDLGRASSALLSLGILPEEEQGFTNIGEGIAIAREQLATDREVPSESPSGRLLRRESAIILLTDGKANAPEDPGGELFALEEARRAKEAGIAIHAIGLGGEVNDTFLEQVASLPDQAYHAAASTELSSIYKRISSTFCERGAAIIDVIPVAEEIYFGR